MLSRCLTLIILWGIGLNAFAIPNADLMSNLRSRLHPYKAGGTLIKSFTNHSQSYIYDQALAVIAFSKHGDKKSAQGLLLSLSKLQKTDGSLYFSYYLNGQSPYPTEGDKRYAGAIAWVALAAITYQSEFKSKDFLNFNSKVLKYLASEMKATTIEGKKLKAIRFAPSNIKTTAWDESETAALEHNLDAYAAFIHFAQINNDRRWNKNANELKEFILTM